MARHTSETLLISALLNTEDPQAYERHGLKTEHFSGHREEFDWVVSYVQRHGRTPTSEELLTRYPTFPYSVVQDRLEYPAAEVMEEYAKRTLARTMAVAGEHLRTGDVEAAYEAVGVPMPVLGLNQGPVDLLQDTSFLDRYDEVRDAVAVPWATPQYLTDGVGRGELWYLAARPANGKSATLLNLSAEAMMRGQNVVLYSTEMSADSVRERLHAYLANKVGLKGVTHTAIRRRQLSVEDYRYVVGELARRVPGTLKVFTPRELTINPAAIAAYADDYDLSVIDYIGHMRTNKGKPAIEDWRIMAEISNELKAVTLAKNARVISAVQINRDGEGGPRRRAPKLSQLAQSDAIGQDGDVVITMNRYSKTTMTYNLVKNRNAESDRAWWSNFLPDIGNFDEITRADADDIADNEVD